ncbi:MAG TPA: hypothetical protein VFW09_03960 [Solirubrobacteraceae bacterium]|nr:hypothetical protein [Solirubrobacteraceae bacterium]
MANTLTQALQSTGIKAFGLAMPVLAQDWAATGSGTFTVDEPTLALRLAGDNWAAPCDAAWTAVQAGIDGFPFPVTLTAADGTVETTGGVLLTVFEAASLRLGRLYAEVLETASATRPERARGLPIRQVPRYFYFPGQLVETMEGIVDVARDLGFSGELRIYDNDGLPIDPVAVMAAFNALMVSNQLLQSGTPSASPALGGHVSTLAPTSESRVRVVTPDGKPFTGSLLTGVTAVSAATGAGVSTATSATPVAVQAVSSTFNQADHDRVLVGPATSGRLTSSFSLPTLPGGVTLGRDFFTLQIVQLRSYLLGTPASGDPGTQAQPRPDVRINENPTLLATGNDVLGAIQSALPATASPTLAAAPSLDGAFTLPASTGAAAHWPQFPTGVTPDAGATLPVAMPDGFTATAAWFDTAAADFTRADVVVTLAGWPSVARGAWVRLYTRLFGLNAVQLRGDGQGRLIPALGSLAIYLTDPLGLRTPGLAADQIVIPSTATLNFDMAVVLPNGSARIYGGLATTIAAGPTPDPTGSPGSNPLGTASCLRGICSAGILGLGRPLTFTAPTSLAGWVDLLTGDANPREAPRLPTMARRELLAAGLANSAWSGVIAGGRVAHETVSDLPRIGCPGGLGGRDTIVTGVATAGGRLAYDIARHALRRAQSIADRVVTLAGSAWALPAEPTAVAVGQQPSAGSGTFAGAALQNIAPYCESPELQPILAGDPTRIDDAIDSLTQNTTILPSSLPDRQDIVNALNSLKSSPPAGNPTPSDTALIIAAELIRELSTSAFGRRDTQWALADAIATARHFIYIETPGFCSTATAPTDDKPLPAYAVDLVKKLGDQLDAKQGLRLMICCPKYPDFAPGYEGMAAYEVADRYKLLTGEPTATPATLPALPDDTTVGFHPIGFPGRYSRIETTVVIVDDRWLLIGGCTFRRRGLTFDGSSDLVLTDAQLENGRSPAIRDFRRTLMAARLGVPADQEHPSFVQLFDGQRSFDLIRQTLLGGGLGKIDLWWNGQTPGITPAAALSIDQANPDGRTLDLVTANVIAAIAASIAGV